MLKRLVKSSFRALGLEAQWRDPLAEQIPAGYPRSPFLPRVTRINLRELHYKHQRLQQAAHVEGDLVECGVSIGHGMLVWILTSELIGKPRRYFGFDSFEGFPEPTVSDAGTSLQQGDYATPPEIVHKVLRDGGVDDCVINEGLTLVKGWFEDTLPHFDRPIAVLHLDVDLYDSYKTCLEHLYDRVVPGGVILFDEYREDDFPGATKAIDEFFAKRPEQIVVDPIGKAYVVKSPTAARAAA